MRSKGIEFRYVNTHIVIHYKIGMCIALLLYGVLLMGQRPNVVLIMADDMGYECLGVNGCTEYSTPNLDRIARASIRFTNCYSQPLCTPSRVKIMTGKYNFRNYEYFGYLHENEKTFGTLMQEAGYKTCMVGKWQLNGHYYELDGYDDPQRPNKMGFDEFALWQVTNNKGGRFANPYINTNGVAEFHGEDAYGPDIFSDYAIDFIRRNKEQPFFLYYPMVLVHSPFVPTPDSPEWKNPEKRSIPDTSYFSDMVSYSDKIVGRLEKALKDEGIYDNTIFIFTADNGTHFSLFTNTKNRIVKGAKGNTILDGIHVPLIVNWPEIIQQGRVSEDMVSFADFFPSFAELVKKEVESDGSSFLPVLKNEKRKHRDEKILIYYDPMWNNRVNGYRGYFVQDTAYKLYNNGSFYNFKEDKLEQRELDPKQITKEERKIYKKLKKELGKVPYWDENGGQKPANVGKGG